MRNNLLAILLISLCGTSVLPAQNATSPQDEDPWSAFNFLIGNWTGVGSGQPGEAINGSTTFAFDLDKKIIVRKNRAEYAAQPGKQSGTVHEDLMIIYRESGNANCQAMSFDNEGHTIKYQVTFPAGQSIIQFESGPGEKAPRFRLLYSLKADGTLINEFLIAPPMGEFKSYTKGVLKKVS